MRSIFTPCETGGKTDGTMQVTIRGKKWKVLFTQLPRGTDGECDHPATPGKEIRISTRLSEEDTLETIVHEVLHAADFDKSEEWADDVGRNLARLLWRLGYRKTGVENDPT
jgi:hypothetical protein